MRKIWKMRKVFVPQATVVLILFVSVLCSPTVGYGNTNSPITDKSSATESSGITVAYEKSANDEVSVVESKAGTLKENTTKTLPKKAEENPLLNLSPTVVSTLSKMGLTPVHMGIWIERHPKTTLVHLSEMSEAKQCEVANIALFIRKVNSRVSKQDSWREASALVYYSHKYRVPSDLSVGIAKTESHFNPASISRSGAMGPMQVMWKIHHGMLSARGIATTKDHMLDPERGVEAGIFILSRYIGAYGTVQKALNRYYGKASTVYSNKVNRNIAMLQNHTNQIGN